MYTVQLSTAFVSYNPIPLEPVLGSLRAPWNVFSTLCESDRTPVLGMTHPFSSISESCSKGPLLTKSGIHATHHQGPVGLFLHQLPAWRGAYPPGFHTRLLSTLHFPPAIRPGPNVVYPDSWHPRVSFFPLSSFKVPTCELLCFHFAPFSLFCLKMVYQSTHPCRISPTLRPPETDIKASSEEGG